MKTILLKDIRENFNWALLGLVLFALALFQAWNNSGGLLSGSTLMVTSFGAIVIGLGLGFLQFLPERSADRWAFLIHRPLALSKIFLGKILAGLLLYSLATVVPFLALVLWAASSDQLGVPFCWEQALAGLADLMNGVVLYLLAIFVSFREGKWFSFRVLPLGAGPSLWVVQSTFAREFVGAAGWWLIFVLGSFFAARGVFLNDQRSRWSQIGAFFSNWAGTCFIFPGVPLLALLSIVLAHGQKRELRESIRVLNYERPVILQEGPGDASKLLELDREKEVAGVDPNRLTDAQARLQTEHVPGTLGYRDSSRYFFPVYPLVNASQNERWLYNSKERWFELFDASKLRLGYLTPSGFKQGRPRPGDQFPPSELSYSYQGFVFGRTAFFLDGENRRLIGFPSKSEIEPPLATGVMTDQTQDKYGYWASAKNRWFLVGYPTQVEIHDLDKNTTVSFLRNSEGDFEICPLVSGNLLIIEQPSLKAWEEFRRTGKTLITELREYASDGALLSDNSVALNPGISDPSGARAGVTLGLGIAPFSSLLFFYKDKFDHYDHGSYFRSIAIQSLSAMALMLWSLSRRRHPRSSWFGWLGAAALTGWPGMIAWGLTFKEPVKINCPNCSRKRRIDLEQCELCGSQWPAPTADGTEIFDVEHSIQRQDS